MQKNTKSNPLLNYLLTYTVAALIGLMFFVVFLSLLSFINLKKPIFDTHAFIAELIAVLFSAAVTGLFSCKAKNKAIINGCVSGTFLSLFIILLISFVSGFMFNLKELIIIAVCILVSAVSSILKSNFIKPKRRIM